LVRVISWVFGLVVAGVLGLLILAGIAVAVAYPNVPEISGLADYRPKLPMRIYAADGAMLGEFGEERRNFTPISQMPKVLKDAVLAAEDARFYEHGGVDYKGIVRAAPTCATRAARAPRPSPCRWPRTSTCRPKRPTRARSTSCC
jgi:penicillin-binding protein 1A